MDSYSSSYDISPRLFKRQKMVVHIPNNYSALLAAFKAHKTGVPTRQIERESSGRSMRPSADDLSYAEDDLMEITSPQPVRSASSFAVSDASGNMTSPDPLNRFVDRIDSSSDDESVIEVVHVQHRSNYTPDQQSSVDSTPHQRPQRAAKARINPGQMSDKRTAVDPNVRRSQRKPAYRLISDTIPHIPRKVPKKKVYPETERGQVRQDIASHTKPKRDSFLLHNKSYFLPLLPENNYITKLERSSETKTLPEVNSISLSQQPNGVTAVMKPYQLDGLSFLAHMHENGVSAILGDEMGLGKTLQTLSLFQYLAENKPVRGEPRPSLVICPLSVLSSWMAEARKWTPDLTVVRFHGPKAERDRIKQEYLHMNNSRRSNNATNSSSASRIDIFLTTYESFVAEQSWFKRAFVWRYCVLDEGHRIKNNETDVASALQTLSAEYRLLLTGTPLQNNLHEMWALLHWLFPEVFTGDTAHNFKQAFDLSQGRVSSSFMDDARRLLELIMLRRTKTSPGVNLGLPPREEVLLFVPLTPLQRLWYTRLITKSDKATLEMLFADAKNKEIFALMNEQQDEQASMLEQAIATTNVATTQYAMGHVLQTEQKEPDTKSSDWRKLMNLLMQLRKVCSHPYLIPHVAPLQYYLGDHIKEASGKFIVLDKLIDELVLAQRKKILIFSSFSRTLDLCGEFLRLKGAGGLQPSFTYARLDGSTARARRNLVIRMFNDMNSNVQVMLISVRAGGLGINLTSATEVVFMDEDWNPQITLQAEARAHRIGQTKKVTVYKLCSQGTVEEQMMGRIRKKLYLSAKVMDSMRNIHSSQAQISSKKRKRGPSEYASEDDAPQLDTSSLQSLIRRGAETLARPEIDVKEMMNWDWPTIIEKCKDRPASNLDSTNDQGPDAVDEQAWLNTMERVETTIFEGRKHHRDLITKQAAPPTNLDRSARREGKNVTVEVNGYMINKESLLCADWEAVPTLAGKDPRLAETVREKAPPINHQDHCQVCWESGKLHCCTACPRAFHLKCFDPAYQTRTRGWQQFRCPQHKCGDCGVTTADAGGLIYRCRWCDGGSCEECLDWDQTRLVGDTLPEFEMLGFERKDHAFFVECSRCVGRWENDKADAKMVRDRKAAIDKEVEAFYANGTDNAPSMESATAVTGDMRMKL